MNPRHDHDTTAGHGEWDALAVGWAMSALDPEDEAVFLPHLATCDQCARTVADTTRTVGELAWAVPAEEPPPALRDRLMSAVHAEPRGAMPARGRPSAPPAAGGPPAGQPPGPAAQLPPSGPPGDAGPGPSGPGRPAAPGPDVVVPFRRRFGRGPLAAAAAAVLLVAGLGGWNAKLHSDQSDLQRRLAQRDAIIGSLTESGPAEVVALADAGGKRVGTVVVHPTDAEVVADGLPTTGGATYWLWGLSHFGDPSPVALGEFPVTSGGLSLHVVISGQSGLDAFRAFAVSREQGSGTPNVPTTPLVAAGQLR